MDCAEGRALGFNNGITVGLVDDFLLVLGRDVGLAVGLAVGVFDGFNEGLDVG